MIEYRAYAATYRSYHANPKAAQGDMVDLVKAIEFDGVQAEIDDAAQ